MTKLYVLIVAEENITTSSRFYYVEVGKTHKDGVLLQSLSLLAKSRNWYLKKRSSETATFLMKIAQSLSVKMYDLSIIKIKISKLIKQIREVGISSNDDAESREAAQMRALIRPSTYFQRNLSVLRRAEAEKRKKPKSVLMDDKV